MFLSKPPEVEPQLFLTLIWFSGFTKHPCCLLGVGNFCPFAAPHAHLFLSLAVFITCPSPLCCCLGGHAAHSSVPVGLDLPTLFAVPAYTLLLHLLVCSEPKFINYILTNNNSLVSHAFALAARRVTSTAAVVCHRDHPEMSPQPPEQF